MRLMAGGLRRHGEEKALLLAGISHDLRTPLARMRLSLELLGDRDPETRDSLIEDITEMDAIIGAFIASVRDQAREPPERLDPNTLVRQAAARLERAGTAAALDLAPLPVWSLGRGALARVLDNLLENARRHGAPPITLRTRNLDGAGLRIAVLDRGPGLPPEELARLFQPFTRGLQAHARGTGLGLFTARRLVREQGGELSLHPRPGGGLEARLEWRTKPRG
jgi:two-component system osmolarity sensor histidine kinase EnvZ